MNNKFKILFLISLFSSILLLSGCSQQVIYPPQNFSNMTISQKMRSANKFINKMEIKEGEGKTLNEVERYALNKAIEWKRNEIRREVILIDKF